MSSALVCAQEKPKEGTDTETTSIFWTGNFASGQVIVPVDKIASVAQQKYILDAQFVIHEVSIDSLGNSLIRIYYIEPIAESASSVSAFGSAARDRARELAGELQGRTGTQDLDPETAVTKNYPTTTHSHTVEFRVSSIEELRAVYRSVSTAFTRSKGRTYNSRK